MHDRQAQRAQLDRYRSNKLSPSNLVFCKSEPCEMKMAVLDSMVGIYADCEFLFSLHATSRLYYACLT